MSSIQHWSIVAPVAWDLFNPGTLQSESAVTNPSSWTETNFEWQVTPGTTNYLDSSGRATGFLKASGSVSTASSITVTIKTGGYPDQVPTFYYTDDAGVTRYGWSDFTVVCGFETLKYDGSSTNGYQLLRGVTLDNGDLVVAVEEHDSGAGVDRVSVITRTWATSTWSTTVTVYSTEATGVFSATRKATPDIVKLPGGRLVIASLERFPSWSSDDYLRLDYSDNGGLTWGVMGQRLLKFDRTSYNYDMLRLSYDRVSKNYILGVRRVTGGTYSILTYRSSTGGTSWDSMGSAITDTQVYDIVTVDGVTSMAYVINTGGSLGYLKINQTSGGTCAWQTVTAVAADVFSPLYLSMMVMHNGWIVVYGRDSTYTAKVLYSVSTDRGRTWGNIHAGTYPYSNGVVSNVTTDISATGAFTSGLELNGAVYSVGQTYLLGNLTSAGVVDKSAVALVLGDFANVPERYPYDTILYYPSDLPSAKGWGAVVGAPTAEALVNLSGVGLTYRLTNNTGATGYYSIASSISKVKFRFKPNTGGATTNTDVCVALRTSDGVNYREVQLRFSTTQVQMYDAAAAATRGSAATFTAGVPIDILLVSNGATAGTWKGSAWWKASTSRSWTAIATNQTLSNTGVGAAGFLRFGSLAATAANVVFDLQFIGGSGGVGGTGFSFGQDAIEDGFTLSEDMIGYPLSTTASPIPSGATTVNVWGISGPFQTGDTFTLETKSLTAASRIIDISAYPSPRDGFQSGVITPGATENLTFNVDALYNARIDDLVLMAVMGSSAIKTVRLRRWTGAAWSTVITHNCYEDPFGSAPSWVRSGVTSKWFVPNGANSNPRYFRRDELKGQMLEIQDDTGGSTVFCEIEHNTDGQWSTASGAKSMAIQVATIPSGASGTYASLATSASGGSNSMLRVYWRDSLILDDLTSNSVIYYRIEWDYNAFQTSGDIGKILVCRPMLIPRQYGPGDQHGIITNDETIRQQDGRTRARQLGPPARNIRLPWRKLMLNQARYNGGTVINTHATGSTQRAVADSHLDQVLSVIEREGTVNPLVLVSQIEMSVDPSSSPATLYGKDKWMWCRIAGELQATMGHGRRWGTSSSAGNNTADFDLIATEEV